MVIASNTKLPIPISLVLSYMGDSYGAKHHGYRQEKILSNEGPFRNDKRVYEWDANTRFWYYDDSDGDLCMYEDDDDPMPEELAKDKSHDTDTLMEKVKILQLAIESFFTMFKNSTLPTSISFECAKNIGKQVENHAEELHLLREYNKQLKVLTADWSNFSSLEAHRKFRMKGHLYHFKKWQETMPLLLVQLLIKKCQIFEEYGEIPDCSLQFEGQNHYQNEIRKCYADEYTLLREDLDDLHALFAYYSMNTFECSLICEWHDVRSLFTLKKRDSGPN